MGDTKSCMECKGRGHWSTLEEQVDGETELMHYFCFDCDGTGLSQDNEDADPFDVPMNDDEDDK